MNDDLIAFLKSRYDDEEQAATEASPGPWTAEPSGTIHHSGPSKSDHPDGQRLGRMVVASVGAYDLGVPDTADAAHIAYWDPTRVLADVDANRRILDWCQAMDPFPGMGGILAGEARKILKWLASPYANHPDFPEEWGPNP